MADKWALQNGAWSNTATWNNGTKPQAGDDVFAEGRIVTIDENINVLSLRTTQRSGGTGGGQFRVTANTSVSAAIRTGATSAGNSTCLVFASAAPNSIIVYGNLFADATGGTVFGAANNSTGTINWFGHIVCSSNGRGVNNSGTFNLSGSVASGTGQAGEGNGTGIVNTNTLNITGTIFGSLGSTSVYSVTNNSRVTLLGNVINGLLGRQGRSIDIGGVGSTLTMIGTAFKPLGQDGTGILVSGTSCTVSITGDVFQGGSGTNVVGGAPGISITGNTNSVNISGNVFGQNGGSGFGGSGNDDGGIVNNSALGSGSVVTVNGNVWGGSNSSAPGIFNGNGTVIVNGNVFGGTGGFQRSVGIINGLATNASVLRVNGYTQGRTTTGVSNNGAATAYIKRVLGAVGGPLNPTGPTSVGLSNSQNGIVFVEEIEYGPQGATPISGPVFVTSASERFTMRTPAPDFIPVAFFNSFSVDGLFPAERDVRLGVQYAFGDRTGTMAVPDPRAVQFDVPVDFNKKGLLFLSPDNFWDVPRLSLTNPDSIGYRLRNVATTGAVGQLIASFNLAAMSGYNSQFPY